jgi:patatin-like phospholipase/acyl hydrolase
MYDTLLFSAGGSLGLSFIGAIEALIDSKQLDLKNVKTIAGISIGSIIGLLIILFKDINYIKELVLNLNFSIVDNCKDAFYFLQHFGFENGEKYMLLIKTILETHYNANITFKELFNETKILFIIQATNLNKYSLTTFSHIETPDLEIIKAIRMSISIPFYFTPIKYMDDYHVDGGVLTYSPHVPDLNIEKTILFRVKRLIQPEESYASFIDYMIDVWICFLTYRIDKVNIANTIEIELDDVKLLPCINEIKIMFMKGYNAGSLFNSSIETTILSNKEN